MAPPTKAIGINTAGSLEEFTVAAGGGGNILDGGNAASTYSGGPIFDCGHAS